MNAKKILKKLLPSTIKRAISVEEKHIEPAEVQYSINIDKIGRLEGQRVIVTGGTGAIGSAICHQLLLQGAIVGIAGRNIAKVDELTKRLVSESPSFSDSIVPLQMDVTDDKSIEMAIDEFIRKTNGIDALINNAGGSARGKSRLLFEQEQAVIDEVINTNLRGSIVCARIAAKAMISQGRGRIINMSSVVGMRGKAKMTDYAAAKAGIIGFTKALAIELGTYGITVNSIAPGMVNQTPFDAGMKVQETGANCLKRFGYTDEVANLVSFILSKEADYITGHNFVVDGGRTLGLMGD